MRTIGMFKSVAINPVILYVYLLTTRQMGNIRMLLYGLHYQASQEWPSCSELISY